MTTSAPESLLVLLQGDDLEAHPGLVDGYRRLLDDGTLAALDVVPVFGPAGTSRGPGFWDDVVERAAAQQATTVLFHYYHHPTLPDPRPAIDRLRERSADLMVVATLGDAFTNGWVGGHDVPRTFLQLASTADLVTLTSMGGLAAHVRRATRAPIVINPNGVCQVRFAPPTAADLAVSREFDVAFIGSRNRPRNPLRPYHWASRRRERLVHSLSARFGRRFAVFGNGWDHLESARGPVDFTAQADAARRARVLVGGIPFSRNRYYTSNRVFFQGSSGVPMVDVAVPGVDTLLRPGDHWTLTEEEALVDTTEAMVQRSDDELTAMGLRSATHVFAHHTQAHRCAGLVEQVSRVRQLRSGRQALPHLPFFLPEVDHDLEAPLATAGWGTIS